jgi:hypothetical protein
MWKSYTLILVFLGAVLFVAVNSAQAQVNFSPTWGKRSSMARDLPKECKLPFDGVAKVLKLIQVILIRIMHDYGCLILDYLFRLKHRGF